MFKRVDFKVKLRPVTLCEVFILFFLIHETMNLERTLTAGEVFILYPHCWLLHLIMICVWLTT